MERVLQIEEILRQIFENLLLDFDMKRSFIDSTSLKLLPIPDKLTRKTLVNAALTCRSFTGPALDALWWAMDDVKPLFSLLPSFQRDEDLAGEAYTISGPIFKPECLKFDAYARRIKFFRLRDNQVRGQGIVRSAYFQVLQALGRSFLLPSLLYFRCDHNSPRLMFFLSPCLRAFRAFESDKHSEPKPLEINAFLNLLGQAAPNLACLALHILLERQCFEAVCRIPQLKYLSLRNSLGAMAVSMNPEFLQTFSAPMTLSCLHVRGNITFPACWSSSGTFCFPALTSIRIDTQMTLAQITDLFCAANFPRLEELIMSFRFPSNGPRSDDFLDFSKHLAHSTGFALRVLDFSERKYSVASKHATSISAFAELRSLPLTKFRMLYLNSISMADVKMIVDWWPNLQVLKIKSFLAEKPGFGALTLLAKGLPRLTRLEIDLDCSSLPLIEDVPLLTHPLKNLHITVPTSRLASPILVARCIDILFPTIREISVGPLDGVMHTDWGECREFLSALRAARKQELLRKYETPDSDIDSDIDM